MRKNPHAVALGKKGGQVGGLAKSPAKTAAARLNGAKGGRPRKFARVICTRCCGSGEGWHADQRCTRCDGSGVEPFELTEQEPYPMLEDE
jgi:hypothetical protein